MFTRVLDHIVPKSALRLIKKGQAPKVTNMELFFDLVYVFSIIQLSHYLLEHLTLVGALQTAVLFAAVWWAWNYTAWATNWLNPDRTAGRIVMVILMMCGLAMSIAIPYAFGEYAAIFVGAYVLMGLFRAGYMSLLFRGTKMAQNYLQLGVWSGLAGILWIIGVLVPEYRLAIWAAALLVDYVAPLINFWLPRLGGSPMSSWPLSGLHLAERNQLVFIIALGESILQIGAATSAGHMSPGVVAAALSGFIAIVLLWWLYFTYTSAQGEKKFENVAEDEHTKLARAGYAYSHGIMVAGAITIAVGIEQTIAHPMAHVHLPTFLVATTGVLLYLLGSALFSRSLTGKVPAVYYFATAATLLGGWLLYILEQPTLFLAMWETIILGAVVFVATRSTKVKAA